MGVPDIGAVNFVEFDFKTVRFNPGDVPSPLLEEMAPVSAGARRCDSLACLLR